MPPLMDDERVVGSPSACCQTGPLGQEILTASASPTSIVSPGLLHRSTSYADTPIFRSTSMSLAELKKPLYGSGSAAGGSPSSADLDAFLRSNDWDRDETRPRIGAEPSSCFATEQTSQAITIPVVLNQQHRANRPFGDPNVPPLEMARSAPGLDDALQMSDSSGIGSLDRLRLSGRMLTSPKSPAPTGGSPEKLETSTSNPIFSVFSLAAAQGNPATDLSMQAGGTSRMRRQSNPEVQSAASGQKPTHRLSLTSSRLGRVASKARRQSSPGLQSAGVQKPSNRLPSSSQPLQQAGCASPTIKQSSSPRRQSLDADISPTYGLPSPTRPSSHLPKHRCQTDGCNADLSDCKPYVRRYRLCWTCMKSSAILVDSKAMRFCQQCSRLHDLSMFDGKKKSCRVKLIELKQRRMAQ